MSDYPFISADTIYRLKKFITAYRCLSAEEVISKFDVAYASRWQYEERYAVSYVDHSFEAKRKYTRNLKSRIWAKYEVTDLFKARAHLYTTPARFSLGGVVRNAHRISSAAATPKRKSKHCHFHSNGGIASIASVDTLAKKRGSNYDSQSNICNFRNKYNFVEQNKTSKAKFVVPGLPDQDPSKQKNKKSKF